MRSYYAHLETTLGGEKKAILPRPTYRSSAIFPVFHQPGISTRFLFLGYWLLKRNIMEIACIVTLRSETGKMLSREILQISEAKTYSIEATEHMERAGLSLEEVFYGSLELEFFSITNLFFPYPAVVVNYYGPNFSSVVHTAQRVYNDFEDMSKNSQTAVPESGFNIYADEDREPFLSFINGPEEMRDSRIQLHFYNSTNELLTHTFELGTLQPYETKILYPAREVPLKEFLRGQAGAGKAYFQLKWIFPRLVVGNIQTSISAMTITHTYYDCTCATSDSDYWRPAEPAWHPATLMVPLTASGEDFTHIYFYPIYSPSTFSVDIEIYNEKGDMLGGLKKIAVVTSPSESIISIRLKDLCKQLNIIPATQMAARIIAHPEGNSRLPARIKLGLDLGNSHSGIPCNICTNLQPFNPLLEEKSKSFKWAPILSDHPNASVWIMNSSPHISDTKDALVDVTFFRQSDANTLVRHLTLPPHGFIVIHPDTDKELHRFLQNQIGWFTATSSNPYTTTYYFSTSPNGVVGGDHGF